MPQRFNWIKLSGFICRIITKENANSSGGTESK
jgi:hypothetical protein